MTKQLYVIAAVCLWLLSACQSSTYKYEAVYKDLPFDMPRVEAPKFPDRKVNLADFGAVGNGEELCTADENGMVMVNGVLKSIWEMPLHEIAHDLGLMNFIYYMLIKTGFLYYQLSIYLFCGCDDIYFISL